MSRLQGRMCNSGIKDQILIMPFLVASTMGVQDHNLGPSPSPVKLKPGCLQSGVNHCSHEAETDNQLIVSHPQDCTEASWRLMQYRGLGMTFI